MSDISINIFAPRWHHKGGGKSWRQKKKETTQVQIFAFPALRTIKVNLIFWPANIVPRIISEMITTVSPRLLILSNIMTSKSRKKVRKGAELMSDILEQEAREALLVRHTFSGHNFISHKLGYHATSNWTLNKLAGIFLWTLAKNWL